MDLRARMARTQRDLVLVALALVPLVRWSAADTFSLPKFVLLTTCGLTAATIGLVLGIDRLRVARGGGDANLRPPPWSVVVTLLGALLVLAALLADSPAASFFGPYRRWNGALGYFGALSLALVVAHRFRAADLRLAGRIVAATGVVAALHGLLQWAEVIDQQFSATGTAVFANLGNANFLAAYLAIAVPFLVLEAVEVEVLWQRLTLAAAILLTVTVIVLTDAIQGPVAMAAGLGTGGALWAWQHEREAVARGVGGALVVGGLLAVAGLASIGPLARLAALRTFELRVHYWSAAVQIGGDHPLLGVGPGRYVGFFRSARSLEAAQELPAALEVDGPHNIPLDLLVSAGLPGLLLLVAAWGLSVWAIVGLVRSRRMTNTTIALVAAWVAYLTQAMVSLDTPALLLLGWILTASLVAARRSADQAEAPAGKKPKARSSKRSRRTPTDPVLGGGAALAALVGLVVLVSGGRWIAADAALSRSTGLRDAEQARPAATAAEESLQGPVDLALYHMNLAEVQSTIGMSEAALRSYEASLAFDGRGLRAAVGHARALDRAAKVDEATGAWLHVLDIEPQLAPLWGEAAEAHLAAGDAARAVELARTGVGLDDADVLSWAALGRALHAQGDEAGALQALERAEELGSSDPEVAALLAELRA